MLARILQEAALAISRHLDTPPRVLAVERLGSAALSILLEWPGTGLRRRLVLDVESVHSTLHWTRGGRLGEDSRTGGFGERLLGGRLLAVEPGNEPKILRFRFSMRRGGMDAAGGTDAAAGTDAARGTDAAAGPASDEFLLVAEWTGRRSNLRLLDAGECVIESIQPGGPARGELYTPPPERVLPALASIDAGDLTAALAAAPPVRWARVVAGSAAEGSRAEAANAVLLASRDLPHPSEGSPDAAAVPHPAVSALAERVIEILRSRTQRTAETRSGGFLYVFPRNASLDWPGAGGVTAHELGLPAAEVGLSDLPALLPFLRTVAGTEEADEPDLMELLSRAHAENVTREREEARRAEALRLVQRELARLLRLRENLLLERGDEAEGRRLRGSAQALLAHLHAVPRGASEFRCPDWSGDPEAPPLVIALDPARTTADNAQDYFRKARRWERGEPHRVKRLAAIDKSVAQLATLRSRWQDTDYVPRETVVEQQVVEALGVLRRGGGLRGRSAGAAGSGVAGSGAAGSRAAGSGRVVEGSGRARGSASGRDGGRSQGSAASRGPAGSNARTYAGGQRPAGPAFRPRSFTTREGWTVLVGRSNNENDYLTHRMAHPEDIWMHAHGVPGSHVILRREGRKDNPSARTLEEAASIAAYFSKARHSGRVPVIYTLKKHVRKPRQAKPGLAVCTREKTILVPPKNPEEGLEPEWMEE